MRKSLSNNTHKAVWNYEKIDIYLSIYLPIHLNPRGGRQTGIPEYQVLRGLVEIK